MQKFSGRLTAIARKRIGDCALAFVLSLPIAGNAAPLAGTTIDNQASATYIDSASGQSFTLTSNVVQIVVQQVSAFTLTSSQAKIGAPGSTVNFQHTLTNTGNGTESFALAASDAFAGGFNFAAIGLYADANNDGIPDNFTPITSTGPLAPGAAFRFIASAQVPGGAAAGTQDQLTVTASGTATALPAPAQSNADTVTVSSLAVVNVTKSLSAVSGPSPFAGVTVTLTYTNIGTAVATNVTLADVIGAANLAPAYNSAGFSYVAGSARWSGSGVALTDAAGGDPAGITYEAAAVGVVTTINAVIASVAPGGAGALTFRLDVRPGLPPGSATTQNAVAVSYHDGAAVQVGGASNTVSYTVIAAAAGPDLQLGKSHVGNFTVGMPGDYTLVVRNTGNQATSGAITVTDTLHGSLNFSAAGSGGGSWTCGAAGQTVTCTSAIVVPAGQSHPDSLTIRVIPTLPTNPPVTPTPTQPATPAFTNTATVSGGGELVANNGNNTATDPTLTLIQLPSSVSGRVWQDLNHDRMYTTGEPLLSGWIVELRNASSAFVKTTTTDGNGAYSMSGLVPGAGYKIMFRDPSTGIPITGTPVNGENGTPYPGSDAVVSNGIIQSITLVGGMNIAEQSLPLDPSGVVYDALTRKPVAGAVVNLTGPAGFDPSLHLVGGAANVSQTTGALGFYQYIFLAGAPAGVYTIAVTPPAGYQPFPSALIPPAASTGGCAAANCLDPTGLAVPGGIFSVQPANIGTAPPAGADTTYYLRFDLNTATDPNVVNNHIPLDPLPAASGTPLLVQKAALRNVVDAGDFLDYSVRVQNATVMPVNGVVLVDTLPFGFVYVKGSARLGGVVLADPPAGNGANFALGTIAAGATVTLTYRVRVGPGAERGDGVNRAQAVSGALRSNVSSVKVKVNGGVFSDRGFIVGKVYLDCNGSGVQDAGEPGIPGVRLFIEDGTSVVSDSEGKYSFYGLKPRTHLLKLDPTTLPAGARMVPLANRNALDAGSRFADITRGELHRADFAEGSCSLEVMADVKARREKGEVVVAETERMLKSKLNENAAIVTPADRRALPTSGVIGINSGGDVAKNFAPVLTTRPSPAVSNISASPAASLPSTNLDQLMPGLDNTLGFVGLKDRDTLPIAQTHVVVKGATGASLRLSVNGEQISERRVGRKLTLEDRQLLVWEYIGVDLKPGENTLEAAQFDQFSNARGTHSIIVIAPDRLRELKVEAPASVPADGFTPVRVRVKLVDAKGVPVTVRTQLTLEAGRGRWQAEDLDKKESGVQVFVEGGSGEFTLLPPQQPGDDVIRISSGVLKAEHRIAYLPELRPMVGAGIVEGAINLRSLNLRNLVASQKRDGFEDVLTNLHANDKNSAGGRAALFLKGKVKGEYLLTLAYDSDKDVRERLFRDIQPDEFYPVYGDSSLKGFDAQSTSRLYVRVDKGKSHVLYGDFTTQTNAEARRLSQLARSLTGVRHHFESGSTVTNVFASNDTSRQIIEEFPANGTSGPFQLRTGSGLINSERVEVLTRDRNQPSVIIKTESKARFTDYEIESFTGRLLFKAPIPSLDIDLNPVSIRVTYEVDQGGDRYWVGGFDAQVKLTDNVEVGGNFVQDDNPQARMKMGGVNTTVKLGEKTFVLAELASTDREIPTAAGAPTSGKAGRIELRHEDGNRQARVSAGKSDAGFDNPSSVITKGREEVAAKATYRVDPKTSLTAEAIHTADMQSGGQRDGLLLKLEHSLSSTVRMEVGVRRSRESLTPAQATSPTATNPGAAPVHFTSVRAKLTAQVPDVPQASVFGEVEQDIEDASKKLAAVGGEYQFSQRGKLYGRHQFISSLGSPFALNTVQRSNTTVFGIDTEYAKDANLFSEYRARDAFDARTAEAAVGLRNTWNVAPGLRINTSSERVHTFSGTENNSRAITGAIEYTAHPLWKGSARLELRDSTQSDSALASIGLAVKANRDWTLLGRTVVSHTVMNGAATGERTQERHQLGAAYRDTETNVWNALARVERRNEEDTTQPGITLKRALDFFTFQMNYQPERAWVLSGRYATKWVTEDSLGLASKGRTQLVSGRATFDLTPRLDIGVSASLYGTEGFAQRQSGLGLEVGYMVERNLWLSLGYNLFGFKDPDLAGAERFDRGVYMRLRYKFDEELFKATGDGFFSLDGSGKTGRDGRKAGEAEGRP